MSAYVSISVPYAEGAFEEHAGSRYGVVSAYVSIRQHTSAYQYRIHESAFEKHTGSRYRVVDADESVCPYIREVVVNKVLFECALLVVDALNLGVVLMQLLRMAAYVSIRQHTSAYVSMRQQTT